jgi:hypothetical protein
MPPQTLFCLENYSKQSKLCKDLSLVLMVDIMAVDTITTIHMSVVADGITLAITIMAIQH